MPERVATLVLSGGGAKGAFQVGAERVLREEFGYSWERIFGVSVGALNGTLLGQGEYDRLLHVWRTIREEDVYRKFSWLRVAWRLAVRKKLGIYDNTPLRRLIEKHAAGGTFRVPVHVGRVSLPTGRYESVEHTAPNFLDAVWQSATMPVIWEPVDRTWVDGGLRNITPLGDALKYGPAEIVVIVANPKAIETVELPRDIVDVAERSLTDITIHEIMINDVREFIRINRLVQQAEAGGLTLRDENGHPLRYCPITVIQPRESLGDTLDFSRELIAKRLRVGEQTAREVVQPVLA